MKKLIIISLVITFASCSKPESETEERFPVEIYTYADTIPYKVRFFDDQGTQQLIISDNHFYHKYLSVRTKALHSLYIESINSLEADSVFVKIKIMDKEKSNFYKHKSPGSYSIGVQLSKE